MTHAFPMPGAEASSKTNLLICALIPSQRTGYAAWPPAQRGPYTLRESA